MNNRYNQGNMVQTKLREEGNRRASKASAPEAPALPSPYGGELFERLESGGLILRRPYGEDEAQEFMDHFDMENFEQMKNLLIFRIVGAKEEEFIRGTSPSRRIGAYSVTYFIHIYESGRSRFVLPIDFARQHGWGVSETEFYHLALANSPRLSPPVLMPIEHFTEFLPGADMPGSEYVRTTYSGEERTPVLREAKSISGALFYGDSSDLFVLSNMHLSFGASAVLYPGVLERAAMELKGGFWVLPSSIHEVLLLKDAPGRNAESLREMVREINSVCLREEDVLGDSICYYSPGKGVLEVVI